MDIASAPVASSHIVFTDLDNATIEVINALNQNMRGDRSPAVMAFHSDVNRLIGLPKGRFDFTQPEGFADKAEAEAALKRIIAALKGESIPFKAEGGAFAQCNTGSIVRTAKETTIRQDLIPLPRFRAAMRDISRQAKSMGIAVSAREAGDGD